MTLDSKWHGAALVLALVIASSGMTPSAAQIERSLIAGGEDPGLFLVYTGDVIGYIADCGCKKNPSGGLDRRAWVVNQIRQRYPKVPLLLADSGNFLDNPTPDGDARTAALLKGMTRLGYQVVNVGERDIRLGYDDFSRRIEGLPFKFISANIVDRQTSKPVFAPHAVVETVAPDGKSKVRVGLVGAVRFNPVFLKAGPDGGNMVIVEPIERVRAEVEALRGKGVDVIVLLAAVHMDDARRMAQEVKGIDFVLGSYGGQVTQTEERVGDTTILYVGNKGQRIGEVRVVLGPEGATPRVIGRTPMLHLLTREYPQDQGMVEFLQALKPPVMPGEAVEPTAVKPDVPPVGGHG